MQITLSKKAVVFILLMGMIFSLNAITTILYTGVNNMRIVGDDPDYGTYYYYDDWSLDMGGHHIGISFSNSEQGVTPILESGVRFDTNFISIPTKVKAYTGSVEPYAGLTCAIRYPHHEEEREYYYYEGREKLNNFHFGFNVGLDYVNNDQLWFVGVEYFRSFTKAFSIEYTENSPYSGQSKTRTEEPAWYLQTISLSVGLLF